jgi:hypothetical protein
MFYDENRLKYFPVYYVGIRLATDVNLAFMTPFEENDAFKKRKETVDQWAKYEYGRNRNPGQTTTGKVNNEPLNYTIGPMVERWSTSNKMWRVYHPNDWWVEIDSANLDYLIQNIGIAAGGKILSPCIWGRYGSKNVLIAMGTEEWNLLVNKFPLTWAI